MMKEETIELLSRYLDDDLDPHEAARIEELLRSDPEVSAEFDALQKIQRGVARLATREEPPAELDQLVEPLLFGRPTPVRVRPWARWLATAAAIVLGVTVVFEVNRSRLVDRVEGPRASRAVTSTPRPTDRFSLAPLPTSSVPEEERPLGATERILASPIPEVDIEGSPALEVIGPLEKNTQGIGSEDRDRASTIGSVTTFVGAGPEKNTTEARDTTNGALDDGNAALPRSEKKEVESGQVVDDGNNLAPAPWGDRGAGSRGHLYVFMDGETAWQNFETETRCQSGRYVVRIRVNNAVVRDVWPVGIPPAAPSQRLCAAEIIVGLRIENVSDGEYPAEVVIERRGTRN